MISESTRRTVQQ